MIHDAVRFERHDVPTVALFTRAFAGLADAVTRGQQADGLPLVIFPHPLNDRPEEQIRAAVGERIAAIAGALIR